MKSKTVILCGRGDVISRLVELVLTKRKEREVIRIFDEKDVDTMLQEIEDVHPDVVIINPGDSAGDTDLPVQLLKDHSGLKVVTISLEDNSIEVYHRQKVWLKGVADLLSVIEE
jgi:hypothetical protein